MKVLITGATGFVGAKLVKKLKDQGHEIVALTRNKASAKARELTQYAQVFEWNAPHGQLPDEAFVGVESVINLMGENIGDKRWSDNQKLKLSESRVDGTKNLIQALQKNSVNLRSFISTSAIGYYAVNQEAALDESAPKGDGFLSDLCEQWEKAIDGPINCERKVIIRVGVVLGKGGGALGKLLPLFKLGLGGPVGAGKQIMSWIHRDDLVQIFSDALENQKYQGVINGVAPQPVSNKVFTKALSTAVGLPALFPAPPFALKLAMGEMSTIVLDGQNIVSHKLSHLEMKFKYPDIQSAMLAVVRE